MINITTSHDEGVYYYKLFYLAAILIGVAGAAFAAHKKQFSFSEFAFIVSAGILSLIIGSKMALFDSSQWLSFFSSGHLPVETGKTVLGAITGGMLGAWVAGRLCGRKDSVLDLFAVSFPLGMAVQRFGCLFAGCCHGIVTTVPWGITYGPGSDPYEEQQYSGIIPADAAHSLAVHPDQMYHIIACSVIAFIAWKTRLYWKSPSGKFIFSIILYLTFRFAEEFTRFSLQPEVWIGLKTVQWKVSSGLILLSLLLFFRERKYTEKKLTFEESSIPSSLNNLKIFLLAILVLIITFQIGSWLTGDERTIIVFTVFPLCGFILIDFLIRNLFSQKHLKTCCLILFAFIMMSQKADKPADTPESYTAYNFSTGFGRFYQNHSFNEALVTETGTNCNGDPITTTYNKSDNASYKHMYGFGGIGISHKAFYNEWQSTLVAANFYAGSEIEKPFYSYNSTFTPPEFKNAIYGINTMVQYDGRGFGIGVGGSFGNLGYNKEDGAIDYKDYDPKNYERNASFQLRLRFFSERKFFTEFLYGYDMISMGEYNFQFLTGSRFNSDKYLLKAGIASSDIWDKAFIIKGELVFSSKYSFSPEFLFYTDHSFERTGFRGGLTFQYRLYKNKQQNLLNNKN